MNVYLNDVIATYGYSPILARPGFIKEYFKEGGIKCVLSDSIDLAKMVSYVDTYPDDLCEMRNYDCADVKFLWDGRKTKIDHYYQEGAIEAYGDFVHESDFMVIDGKMIIETARFVRRFGIPNFNIGVSHFTREVGEGSRLVMAWKNTNLDLIHPEIWTFDIVDSGMDLDNEFLTVEIPGINRIIDAYSVLPLIKVDPTTRTVVPKTRGEVVKTMCKFLLERKLVQRFGNPGQMISTLDEAQRYVFQILANNGLLPASESETVQGLGKVDFDFVKFVKQAQDIDAAKTEIYSLIEEIVPERGLWDDLG